MGAGGGNVSGYCSTQRDHAKDSFDVGAGGNVSEYTDVVGMCPEGNIYQGGHFRTSYIRFPLTVESISTMVKHP